MAASCRCKAVPTEPATSADEATCRSTDSLGVLRMGAAVCTVLPTPLDGHAVACRDVCAVPPPVLGHCRVEALYTPSSAPQHPTTAHALWRLPSGSPPSRQPAMPPWPIAKEQRRRRLDKHTRAWKLPRASTSIIAEITKGQQAAQDGAIAPTTRTARPDARYRSRMAALRKRLRLAAVVRAANVTDSKAIGRPVIRRPARSIAPSSPPRRPDGAASSPSPV